MGVFDNGGILGKSLDFYSAGLISRGTVPAYKTLVYVGGQTYLANAPASGDVTVNFSLTGGIDTLPREGDFVVIVLNFAWSGNALNFIISDGTTSYTSQVDRHANDTYDCNFQIGTKFMGSTPDTSFTLVRPTGTTDNGVYCVAIHVWRNVDQTTPMDVTVVEGTTIDTPIVNPTAITPVTPGAQILVAGAAAHIDGVDTFGASYLSNFLTGGKDNTVDGTVGLGNVLWTSGAYDPAAWTFTGSVVATYSSAFGVLALRPAATSNFPTNPSGVWSLQAVQQSLSTKIVQNGLVMSLDAGESASYSGSGSTWTDLSGYGNHATLVNAPTYSSTNGGFLQFNGTTQYATSAYSQPAYGTTSSFTWCSWLKLLSGVGNTIIGNRGTDLNFTKLTGSNFQYYPEIITNALTVAGAWQHVTIVKDQYVVSYFLNGAFIGSIYTPTTKPTKAFFIGGDNTASEYSNVNIATLQVYNRALSYVEILDNFYAHRGRFGV